MAKDVIMPALGMAQETGILLEWLIPEGEEVKKGAPLMLVETDKTSVEIEASIDGRLVNIEAHEGDEVPVGTRIAILLAEGETAPKVEKSITPERQRAEQEPVKQQKITPLAKSIAIKENIDISEVKGAGDRIRKEDVLAHLDKQQTQAISRDVILASPKARRQAAENNLSLSDIVGSGPDGAVLAGDIEATLNTPKSVSTKMTGRPAGSSRLWQVMARRLTESWNSVPHFYLSAEVNMDNISGWHADLRKRTGVKISLTDLLVKVTAKALQRHPRINASWQKDDILYQDHINIGLAVAVEDGLQVPVIRDANDLNMAEIAVRRAELVTAARENTLSLTDVSDGSFTISNLGMFGVDSFNAIVNPPQAAILATGKSEDKVVAVDGQMVIQKRMTMTLSCDHRVIDGATGAKFLQTLSELIEDPIRIMD